MSPNQEKDSITKRISFQLRRNLMNLDVSPDETILLDMLGDINKCR
jgi:hypothetical protein